MSNLNIVMSQAAALLDSSWDLSYLYYDPPVPWDISTTRYTGKSFNVAGQEAQPNSVFFKPDGTKMYVLGEVGDNINEYDLSFAWDITTATYLQNFSVAAQGTSPEGLFIKPDGTKMYIVGGIGDGVDEYDLTTAWDISTASYLQNFSVAGQQSTPNGVFFKPDGTKMYIVGSGVDFVHEYDLSTAWDISTASYLQNFSVASQDNTPHDLTFKPDGTKMYMLGGASDSVNEYDLTTAWDISTASYVTNFIVTSQATSPRGMFFKPDGTAIYVTGASSDAVFQYLIGVSSLTPNSSSAVDIFFKPDGTKMFIYDIGQKDVDEYTLSTAWDTSTASYVTRFVYSSETFPEGLFFKPDGTKMYTLGYTLDQVYEWNLSTPWSLSSVTSAGNFSVSAQEVTPQDVFFKPDGTKMYILGYAYRVFEYDLIIPWSVSTATYVQNFIAPTNIVTESFFFKEDGTKMYINTLTGGDIDEYDLSTAWDISTASFTQNTTVVHRLLGVGGMFFKPDGTKLFTSVGSAVYTFSLGVQA